MKQKLQDLKLIIQSDRRIWAGLAFIAAAGFLWVLTNDASRVGGPPQESGQVGRDASKQGSKQTEAYSDLIAAFQLDLEKLEERDRQKNADIDRVVSEFNSHKTEVKNIFETVIDKIEILTKEVEGIKTAKKSAAEDLTPVNTDQNIPEQDDIEGFGPQTTDVPLPPAPNQPVRASVISPGDSVRATLLTGVNAPTDGTPYPVVFKLTGPITGPDGVALDIGEARLIAAAQGSESDSRAIFRLTNLAIRHKDGRRSVVPVDGWIVGEDGIRGMRGRLIDKLGRLIAATFGVTFMAALGEGLEDSVQDSSLEDTDGLTVNGDDIDFATASAVTDASNRLGQILVDRYEKLVPVVEVLSGRDVAAVFSTTAEIETLPEDFEDGLQAYSLD